MAEIVGGGTPSTNIPEYWDGDIDWYAPAEINDQIYVDGSERKITKLGLEKSSAKILPADKTVLFTSRAGIGKTAILRRSGATNQGFQSMVLNDETNPYFVFSMSKFIKEEAERIASGSTFAEVSGKMLGNLTFMFPTKQEQDKIGEYFSNLDNLITLHQRKQSCNTLLINVWEQRKVSDVFKITRGYVLATTETSPSTSDEKIYPVYSSQTKNEGLMGYYRDYLYEDAITWTTDGANAGTVKFRKGKFYCTNVCGVLLSNEGIANKAVAEALNAVAWKYVSHVGNPKLMNNVMSEIDIMIPKTVEEQQKISEYLDNLDNLITLHRRAYHYTKRRTYK